MNGRIIRVLQDKGFGFLEGEDKKQYFFHMSALKNVKIVDLKEGVEVIFEDVQGSKGLRAEDIRTLN